MNATNFLLIILIGVVAFAAIPQILAVAIGFTLGLLVRVNLPRIKGKFQWT